MLPFHPLADLFPLIEGDAFDELVDDVRAHGIIDPLYTLGGMILDGRNRMRAAEAASISIPPHTLVEFNPQTQGDPLAFVISKNLKRRHLNESQRGMVAARLATMREGRPSQTAQLCAVSQSEAATTLNVSRRTLQAAAVVQQHGTPELQHVVDQGRLSVSQAARAARLDLGQQRAVAEHALAGDERAARTLIKQAVSKCHTAELSNKQTALPPRKYGVIYIDPEWTPEQRHESTGLTCTAENREVTPTMKEIVGYPVAGMAADECWLFLWAPSPRLSDALRVMAAWGFTYTSQCVWLKDRLEPGCWKFETLLIGTRGNLTSLPNDRNWGTAIVAPRGPMSANPDRFYDLIEADFPALPKIILNARQPRPGWDVWGVQQSALTSERSPVAGATIDVGANQSPLNVIAPTEPELEEDPFYIPPFLRR